MVSFPQQLVPAAQDITSTPDTFKRLYGPGRPIPSPPGPMTVYTVPTDKKAIVTSIILANTDVSSPPIEQRFTLSIGADAEDTRLYDFVVPLEGATELLIDITLEAAEFLQATVTSELTLTINGREVSA